jgi:hypothetical protein
VFEGAAAVGVARGDADSAARLLGAGARIREAVGLAETAYPPGEEVRARTSSAAREALGPARFDGEHVAGRDLPAEAALDEAARVLAGGSSA